MRRKKKTQLNYYKVFKLFKLLFILTLFIIAIVMVKNTIDKIKSPKTIIQKLTQGKTVDDPNAKLIKEQQKLIKDISTELQDYKSKQQEEELRRERIKALQNPEIIQSELGKAGFLNVYTGNCDYADVLVKKRFLGKTELGVKFNYTYGYGVGLDKIIIADFIDDQVIIQIPKNEVVLKYVELNSRDDSISQVKKFFGEEFSVEEMNNVLTLSKEKVINDINSNIQIKDKAMQNLKNELRNMILKLGYKKVVFEEI